MRYVLYGYGGAYNHGGEAIVRCTCDLIRKHDKDAFIALGTHFMEQDVEFNLPVDKYCQRDLFYLQKEKDENVPGKYTDLIYKEVIDEICEGDIVLAVGGDNYCYDNWRKWIVIHDAARSKGAKTILWSCSIEPKMIDKGMINHLKSFDLITARESITYDTLLSYGLINVRRCFDVAFGLEASTSKRISTDSVVVNVSPLIVRRETKPGVILDSIFSAIDYILETSIMDIILLPHVLMPVDNDVEMLSKIKAHYIDNDRVILLSDNLSAAEYKGIISQCSFGIFARTHASIAAYSSCVPSIVLGYSVKSAGIAKDLGLEDYIIPIDKISESSIKNSFIKLVENRNRLQQLLVKRKSEIIVGHDIYFDMIMDCWEN